MDYGIDYAFAFFSMLFIHLNRSFVEGAEVVDDMEWELDVFHTFHQVVKTFAIRQQDALNFRLRSNDVNPSFDESGEVDNRNQVIKT